ncbi:hypothetical protein BDQ12DRAFT_7651 [Crucibulum laeve]|uniref:Uncharacterized protein n=1 Tax=Crucibulum laeve TaxID=68775 RepID=A0A5C3MSC4_9AGAR|nr:hypothetical protein BDQ12DRAFT_7651 [Crucibulum laeve]
MMHRWGHLATPRRGFGVTNLTVLSKSLSHPRLVENKQLRTIWDTENPTDVIGHSITTSFEKGTPDAFVISDRPSKFEKRSDDSQQIPSEKGGQGQNRRSVGSSRLQMIDCREKETEIAAGESGEDVKKSRSRQRCRWDQRQGCKLPSLGP